MLDYLIIGALIGPQMIGLVGENREEVMHFVEFGVVLMLFVIGLEIDLFHKRLRRSDAAPSCKATR